MSRREHGYVLLRYNDGAVLCFAASERERLETAVRSDARWFEGHDEYGAEVLADISGARAVIHFTPASLEALREDERRDRLDGVT